MRSPLFNDMNRSRHYFLDTTYTRRLVRAVARRAAGKIRRSACSPPRFKCWRPPDALKRRIEEAAEFISAGMQLGTEPQCRLYYQRLRAFASTER